jgi:hypothetical protein
MKQTLCLFLTLSVAWSIIKLVYVGEDLIFYQYRGNEWGRIEEITLP